VALIHSISFPILTFSLCLHSLGSKWPLLTFISSSNLSLSLHFSGGECLSLALYLSLF
jgi:hypothetical protein